MGHLSNQQQSHLRAVGPLLGDPRAVAIATARETEDLRAHAWCTPFGFKSGWRPPKAGHQYAASRSNSEPSESTEKA